MRLEHLLLKILLDLGFIARRQPADARGLAVIDFGRCAEHAQRIGLKLRPDTGICRVDLHREFPHVEHKIVANGRGDALAVDPHPTLTGRRTKFWHLSSLILQKNRGAQAQNLRPVRLTFLTSICFYAPRSGENRFFRSLRAESSSRKIPPATDRPHGSIKASNEPRFLRKNEHRVSPGLRLANRGPRGRHRLGTRLCDLPFYWFFI